MTMNSARRQVLHVDMNAFYCACHAASEPQKYKGRPTAVAGSVVERHGILVTASYEARAKGVRATMTVREALRMCPELKLIAPDFHLYRAYSRRVFSIVGHYTPLIEISSIDECFADVTGCSQFGSASDIAQKIQREILNSLDLPCSIGVSANKFLAKMASDLKKPNGITQLYPEDVAERLWPLPIEQMYGVGKSTAEKLHQLGLSTIGDLAHARESLLTRALGTRGIQLLAHARGEDNTPVQEVPEDVKSIGHSVTLPRDAKAVEEMQIVMMNLADQIGRRLRRRQRAGRTISITLRDAAMKTWTRATTLRAPTDLSEIIYREAMQLLTREHRKGLRLRLLGITVSHLCPVDDLMALTGGADVSSGATDQKQPIQLSLFDAPSASAMTSERSSCTPMAEPPMDEARLRKLTKVTDELRNRYGEDIVVRGRMLVPHQTNSIRDGRRRGTSLQKDNLSKE